MAWKAHPDYVCKKIATRVSILELIRGFVTTKAAVLVYNTIILPIFDYCDIASVSHGAMYSNKIKIDSSTFKIDLPA